MPSWYSLNFQDSVSYSMGELSFLHDHIMIIMLSVIILISYILLFTMFNSFSYKYLSEGTLIETVWSVVPAFVLIFLVVPSMKVLYIMEDLSSPTFTFKVVAHQWYWTYIIPLYSNVCYSLNSLLFDNIEFDSMLEDYSEGAFAPRLLTGTSFLVLPIGAISRFLITSTDVIHSFAMPSLGLKVDALPGRINQLFSNPSRVGVFFGQCSEICGANHSFMPISIKCVDFNSYSSFTADNLLESLSENFEGSLDMSF